MASDLTTLAQRCGDVMHAVIGSIRSVLPRLTSAEALSFAAFY